MDLESYLSSTLATPSQYVPLLKSDTACEPPIASSYDDAAASSNPVEPPSPPPSIHLDHKPSMFHKAKKNLDEDDEPHASSPNKKLKTDHNDNENVNKFDSNLNNEDDDDGDGDGDVNDMNSNADEISEIDEHDDDDDGDESVHKDLREWLRSDCMHNTRPRELLSHMIPSYVQIPDELNDVDICRVIFQIMSDQDASFHLRHKLSAFNTITDVVELIRTRRNIVVLTGAGCSVSCGIPDFRSRNGIYARLSNDFPDLPDPQSMFDIYYFEHDPRPFFKFAKEIYPGQFKPSLSHMFIKKIEEHGKLLRNYTQNIDTLELTAQIGNVIQCHGSFATATCTNCKHKVCAGDIKEKIFNQEIPRCGQCNEMGILKPDIVFFGEELPEHYHKSILSDKAACDLLIVIGSSLKVKPVANIPHMLPHDVPQILINRESLKHMNFDVELLGDCDVIVNELLMRLGDTWSNICEKQLFLKSIEEPSQVEELITSLEVNHAESASSDAANNLTATLKDTSYVFVKPSTHLFEGVEMSLNEMKKLNKMIGDETDDDDTENSTQSSSDSSSVDGERTDGDQLAHSLTEATLSSTASCSSMQVHPDNYGVSTETADESTLG